MYFSTSYINSDLFTFNFGLLYGVEIFFPILLFLTGMTHNRSYAPLTLRKFDVYSYTLLWV